MIGLCDLGVLCGEEFKAKKNFYNFLNNKERENFKMNFFYLSTAFIVGSGLGAFYFGALWLTVQRLPRARRPWLLTLGSFWIRLAVTMSGFYFVMQGRWENLLACLLGFLLMRQLLVRHYRPKESPLPVQ